MSGIIGVSPDMRSGVVGAFPTGQVIQVKTHLPANLNNPSSSNWPSTALGFDNPIQSSSGVLVTFSATLVKEVDNSNSWTDHMNIYINGGGFSSTTDGPRIGDGLLYKVYLYVRDSFSGSAYDSAPDSTTPTYNLYLTINNSLNLGVYSPHFVLMEIAG